MKYNLLKYINNISKIGGADEDRTHDLYNAIVALSQLSYSPTSRSGLAPVEGRFYSSGWGKLQTARCG